MKQTYMGQRRREEWGGGLMAGWCGSTQSDSLGQLHLYLLADFLPLLVAADGEDVAVLQLLLAGPVPKLHSQQLLPHPAGEGPCWCWAQAKISNDTLRFSTWPTKAAELMLITAQCTVVLPHETWPKPWIIKDISTYLFHGVKLVVSLISAIESCSSFIVLQSRRSHFRRIHFSHR